MPDLVGPAVFLASNAAAYMTGQTLDVDGGMTIYGFSNWTDCPDSNALMDLRQRNGLAPRSV